MTPFIDMVGKYDVLSVDVFDTAVHRPFALCDDIFKLLDKKYPGFYEERIRAEKVARRDTGETTLEKIYQCMNNFSKIQEIELDFEFALTRADPDFQKGVQEALKMGKQVVYTSDTYYTQQQLVALLDRLNLLCGSDSKASVLSSSTQGVSKIEGNMWNVLKGRHLDQDIFHIGDHYIADYFRPCSAGIDSCLYESGLVVLKTQPRWQRFLEDYNLTKSFIWAQTAQYNWDSVWQHLGFCVAGPLAVATCEMVHQNVSVTDPEQVPVFLSPYDGLLTTVYERMFVTETRRATWCDMFSKQQEGIQNYLTKQCKEDNLGLAKNNIVFVTGYAGDFAAQERINIVFKDVTFYYMLVNLNEHHKRSVQSGRLHWIPLSVLQPWEPRNTVLLDFLFRDSNTPVETLTEHGDVRRQATDEYTESDREIYYKVQQGCLDFVARYNVLQTVLKKYKIHFMLDVESVWQMYDSWTHLTECERAALNTYSMLLNKRVPLGDAIEGEQ